MLQASPLLLEIPTIKDSIKITFYVQVMFNTEAGIV